MKKNNSKKEGFFHHQFTNSPDIQQVETQEKKKPGNEINKRTRSKSKERSNRETQENQSQDEFEKENSQREEDDKLPVAKRNREGGNKTRRGEKKREGREVDKFCKWSSAELPLPFFSISFHPVGRNFPALPSAPDSHRANEGGDEGSSWKRIFEPSRPTLGPVRRETCDAHHSPFIVGISAGENFSPAKLRRSFACGAGIASLYICTGV